MAAQLADLHKRNHLIMSHKPINLREQYGDPEVIIRGSLRLFGGPDDFNEDEESEEYNVCRVRLHLPTLLRGPEYRQSGKSDQGDPGDPAPLPQLDPPRLHLRDSHHRDLARQVSRHTRFPKHHSEVLDRDWGTADRTAVLLR